jgi:hypothetical protein
MPAKSRRNRRNIPRNRTVEKKPAAAPPVAPSAPGFVKPVRSTYSSPGSSPVSRPTPSPLSHISGEIKRIAVVAAIIIVILVITAVFLR